MRKLLDAVGNNGNRNFYALRHTFETVGGEAKDEVAVDHMMGHVRDEMASVYWERISHERLKAVTEHVWEWLFGEKPAAGGHSWRPGRRPSRGLARPGVCSIPRGRRSSKGTHPVEDPEG